MAVFLALICCAYVPNIQAAPKAASPSPVWNSKTDVLQIFVAASKKRQLQNAALGMES